MTNKIVVILGPTCVGKTSLALTLCKLFGGVIVSADSRQVVRLMDIGTGKIPVDKSQVNIKRLDDHWLIDGVRVYGYDLVNPNEFFSAYDFAIYFRKILSALSAQRKVIFLVGGTGFYIDVALGRVKIEGAGPDFALRESLQNLTLNQLQEQLLSLDKKVYESIDLKNKVRVIRAIEKLTQAPKIFNLESLDGSNLEPIFKPNLILGLKTQRRDLYQRADTWLESIFGEPLFEEVKNIQILYPDSFRLKGLIYKSALNYILNPSKENLSICKERAKFDLHAYIRRQQTYFKKISDIVWLDIKDLNFDEKAKSLVKSAVNG